jgi:hypothetical protein
MDLNELLARHQRASFFGANALSSEERRSARDDASLFGAEIRLLRLAVGRSAPIVWDRVPAVCSNG